MLNSVLKDFDFPDLPITPFLNQICSELKASPSRFLIVTAETAAGKSTAIPLALFKSFSKKIIMLEPRRIATLSIANRISNLLNEEPGNTVGYRMYLESKISEKTKLEIVTEAILTKKIQNDPLLEDVSVVVLDEFHERSVNADLALAFLKEAMELRDDLFVIIMSATIETKELSEYLGTEQEPAPVFKVPGRKFPVQIEYKGNIPCSKAILNEVNFIKKTDIYRTILVFLPGLAEIKKTQNELSEYNIPSDKTEVFLLHSSISFLEQQKVLSPQTNGKIRIILSSSIAETSITVPGVKTVIDSGFMRINKMNISLGMEHLQTERVSVFSAEQRAGRAGRLAPGKCIRLWNKNDVLAQTSQPEILRADITNIVLECALWGISDEAKLKWLTPPNKAAWNEAKKLLQTLDCISETGIITEKGKAVLKIGLNPRLATVALCGHFKEVLDFSNYAKSSKDVQNKFLKNIERRVNLLPENVKNLNVSKAFAILLGFPDRLAKQTETKGLYQFPNARVAHLKKEIIEKNAILPKWIVAPEVDSGLSEGTIFSYFELTENDALNFLNNHTKTITETYLQDGKVIKNELTVYEKLIISTKKLFPNKEDFALALCNKIKKDGIKEIPLSEEAKSFLIRAKFFFQQKNIQDKTEESFLKENVNDWLLPFLSGNTKLQKETVYNALYWFLNGTEIDKNVPTQILLENGKKQKVIYEWQSLSVKDTKLVIRPVIEVIIQRIFGCYSTPKILGMSVLLKLLSPAKRPLQITEDLENFWVTTWPEICKEMKGRYPKHNWDYRIPPKD